MTSRRSFFALTAAALIIVAAPAAAAAKEAINTFGSTANVAISGFDTVAFFTENRPVQGAPEHTYIWRGAEWHFASAANLALFRADPEKYAPQWGGYCAVGVSEGRISQKPVNGSFEIHDGKLYLFPVGRDGSFDGIKHEWHELNGGQASRISAGNAAWPGLKSGVEAAD